MALARLIYASRAAVPVTTTELADLIHRASARNATLDVTGALLYCDGIFLQMLEGPEAAVQNIYKKISQDPRHRDIQKLSYRRILGRAFTGWGMSFLHEAAAQPVDIARIRHITDRLASAVVPEELGDSAQELMGDLKDVIEQQTLTAAARAA